MKFCNQPNRLSSNRGYYPRSRGYFRGFNNPGYSPKAGELVEEIAAASSEQAQGIEQVNKAVTAMDKVVQQVAANAEESAATSEEMNAQAEQMKSVVKGLVMLIGGRPKTKTEESRLKDKPAVSKRAKYKSGVKAEIFGFDDDSTDESEPIEPEQIASFDTDDFKDF